MLTLLLALSVTTAPDTTNPVTNTATAYTNDGTNPAIRITTVTRDNLQISQEKYDPGLRKRTSTAADGVVTGRLVVSSAATGTDEGKPENRDDDRQPTHETLLSLRRHGESGPRASLTGS